MLNGYKLLVTVLQVRFLRLKWQSVAEVLVWRAGVRRESEAARRALTDRTRVRFSMFKLPITLSLIFSSGLFSIVLLRRSKIIVFHTKSFKYPDPLNALFN